MHQPARLAALAVTLCLAVPAAADDGTVVLELEVGQKAKVGGANGRCDDLTVATITLDANAVITALKPGKTTCSARVGGLLRVYAVKVTAPPPPEPGGATGGTGGTGAKGAADGPEGRGR
jgi:hypothetical protein